MVTCEFVAFHVSVDGEGWNAGVGAVFGVVIVVVGEMVMGVVWRLDFVVIGLCRRVGVQCLIGEVVVSIVSSSLLLKTAALATSHVGSADGAAATSHG